MYDFIHNNKRIVQVILVIIFLPFAFFGIDQYFRTGDRSDAIATVGGQPISDQEFARALQQRRDEMQRMSAGRVDPTLLDSAELRFAVLDGIIRQRVLIGEARRNGILVSDRDLQQFIAEQTAFQENDKFSRVRYEEFLRRQNFSALSFENDLRRDLILQRMAEAYGSTAIVPVVVAERLLRLNAQQREVSESGLEPQNFISEVKLEDGAVKQYYDAHANEFQLPEQARLEYLVLGLDRVAEQVNVSPDEVKQFYEQNAKQYAKGEEREASHILIAFDAKASAEEKQAARAKADQLVKQVKQNPASFAELARKYSQDPPSAAKGGELGFFSRGTMVKAFDDAVFNMKAGEIVGPVESPYGYHIIRVTAVRGRGLEDVRRPVELDLKRQKAGKKFSELAEQFHNLTFEQGESLKPAADTLKLPIQTSGWVSAKGGDNTLLNNPKLLQAVFSEDTLKNKRNSEVIDVGNNTLVSARVVEHKPASMRPLPEVSGEIAIRLTRERAAQLAAKHGREVLAKLKRGESETLPWSAPKLVSRANPQGYNPQVLEQAFKADSTKLPAFAGVEDGKGGFVLIRVTRVVNDDTFDIEKRKAVSEQLRQMVGQEELNAYIESLKLKADVKVRQEGLLKKE